jgi:hypothetical protein
VIAVLLIPPPPPTLEPPVPVGVTAMSEPETAALTEPEPAAPALAEPPADQKGVTVSLTIPVVPGPPPAAATPVIRRPAPGA